MLCKRCNKDFPCHKLTKLPNTEEYVCDDCYKNATGVDIVQERQEKQNGDTAKGFFVAAILLVIIFFVASKLFNGCCVSSDKKNTANTKTTPTQQVKVADNGWKGSTEFYNAYAAKGHSPDYIEIGLPLKYGWIKSAKDVLTAASDFGYFSAEYLKKVENGDFASEKEILQQGANRIADACYIEWVAKKYKVSAQQYDKAMQKGVNKYKKNK